MEIQEAPCKGCRDYTPSAFGTPRFTTLATSITAGRRQSAMAYPYFQVEGREFLFSVQ